MSFSWVGGKGCVRGRSAAAVCCRDASTSSMRIASWGVVRGGRRGFGSCCEVVLCVGVVVVGGAG